MSALTKVKGVLVSGQVEKETAFFFSPQFSLLWPFFFYSVFSAMSLCFEFSVNTEDQRSSVPVGREGIGLLEIKGAIGHT